MRDRVRMACLALVGAVFAAACTGGGPVGVAAEPAADVARATGSSVTIAVRKDAPPFAWQSAEHDATFGGYLVDICRDATTRAGFHYDLQPIDAAARERVLEGDYTLSIGQRRVPIDLLCDPTTITLQRLDVLALHHPDARHAIFSPILFVANGSYVEHAAPENRSPCGVAPAEVEGFAGAATRGVRRGGGQLLAPKNCFVPGAREEDEGSRD